MSILLVRHGETAANAARVFQRPDVPLSERGMRQAARLAERLRGMGFAHVLCSDMPRACMTAEPLAAHGVTIETTPLLQERDLGELRGMRYDEVGFDPHVSDYAPPGGETVEAFHRRVAEAFTLIVLQRRRAAGSLVVVTHGLVCSALLRNHIRCAVVPAALANTGLTVIAAEPPYEAELVNCTRHLDELEAVAPV